MRKCQGKHPIFVQDFIVKQLEQISKELHLLILTDI